jgi:pimeloyl-ACP methyl ester carboxylesterase
MDGTGKMLDSQIAFLEESFDLRRLSIPANDLTNWDRLIDLIAVLIRAELTTELPRREIYLCGESFGGCLAIKLAIAAPDLCDRLILINPASSFKQRIWLSWGTYFSPLLPPDLYPLACIALLPFLAALERVADPQRRALLQVMQSVEFKSARWRISLLDRYDVSSSQLQQITQPTLIISSGSDRLLPSAAEGKMLARQIPGSRLHLIPQGGHAVLLERDVNLHDILHKNQFLEYKIR